MATIAQSRLGKGVCLCDKLRAEENNKGNELLQRTLAQSATSGALCPHGYTFCRDNGTRCLGGTHYSPAAEEAMKQAEALNAVNKPGVCNFGFPFNRENGTRCLGGSHVVSRGNNREKDSPEKMTRLGDCCRGCCCHCCVHRRCPRGPRYQDPPAKKSPSPCPLHNVMAPPKRYCQREACEHGYPSPEIPEGPCSTYPTKPAMKKQKNGYCPCVANLTMSDQRFEFCRNDGAKCVGGTHCLSCPAHGRCGAQEDDRKERKHRDLCPYGFHFSRDNGNRCYGGNHRRRNWRSACPCLRE